MTRVSAGSRAGGINACAPERLCRETESSPAAVFCVEG